jgi:hypothetical protein
VRVVFLTLAVLAAGSLTMASAALADDGVSANWAGYAAHGQSFRSATGSWRQPGVTCARGQTAYSSYWVGLGGYSAGSPALEQIGTEADCQSGHPVLSAWYQMVPAASRPVYLPVSAGDTMAASVTVVGHRATLVLTNVTRRRSFSTTASSGRIDISSADWIVEAPSTCLSTCKTLPLANFGSTSFSGARAQLTNGYGGAIADRHWLSTRIRLNPSGRQFAGTRAGAALTSGLSWGGSVFSVAFTTVTVPSSVSYAMQSTIGRSLPLVHPARTAGRADAAHA